jgi:acetyl-CoA acetyltransferase
VLDLRGSAAIVGLGEAGTGRAGPGLTALDLIGVATRQALDDAGIEKGDIDAVFTASSQYNLAALDVAEYLGIRPRFTDSTNVGGSSFLSHLTHAAAAIDAGLCTTALIVYGSTQLSAGGGYVTRTEQSPYEAPFRPRFPVSMYALAASRHMKEYGTTREQLAEVAVAARQWANLNPAAYVQGPLSVEDVLASQMVSSPLTVRDCCLATDGAGALVVTAGERARSSGSRPVFLLGAGDAHWHRNISEMPDLTVTAAQESAKTAFRTARLSVEDVDVAEVYDAFTITTLLFLEDLGFCPKGEGGAFVEAGAIAPGGRLAVNTNGGGLSFCHPGMYGIFLLIEASRQIRGDAGDRQQDGVNVALAHGNGGVLSSQVSVLLGSEATL